MKKVKLVNTVYHVNVLSVTGATVRQETFSKYSNVKVRIPELKALYPACSVELVTLISKREIR